MKNQIYDAIVIGAGSVGLPITFYLSQKGLKVLCIDSDFSAGQGQNKAAIGGVRATHSNHAKIGLALETISVLSSWEKKYGVSIGWQQGGYCFTAYNKQHEMKLKNIVQDQKEFGLNINWHDATQISNILPGINKKGLRGGTFSPEDGQVNPLLSNKAFQKEAMKIGAEFLFNERVVNFIHKSNNINGIITASNKKIYSGIVINASGMNAGLLLDKLHINIPIMNETHEAGISAPVSHCLRPLVVDLSEDKSGKSLNFYCIQNHEGCIMFCYTPKTIISETDTRSTSEFMNEAAMRLLSIFPDFINLRIRRVWGGVYPMTPDGIPIVGKHAGFDNLYSAAGMCGQGLMLGPGVGKNLAAYIVDGKSLINEELFNSLSPNRNFNFSSKEYLK